MQSERDKERERERKRGREKEREKKTEEEDRKREREREGERENYMISLQLPSIISSVIIPIRTVHRLTGWHAGCHQGPELDDVAGGELESIEVGDENFFA